MGIKINYVDAGHRGHKRPNPLIREEYMKNKLRLFCGTFPSREQVF